MSTRLPSINKPKLSKVFASALAVCTFGISAVSYADPVQYYELPDSVKEKISVDRDNVSCTFDFYGDAVVVKDGTCKNSFYEFKFHFVDRRTDFNAAEGKTDTLTLNVGKAEFDKYAVANSSRFTDLTQLYVSGFLPTVYFDGEIYKNLQGGNEFYVEKDATVAGQKANNFLATARFNKPIVAIESKSADIENQGTVEASEGMLEVSKGEFRMFDLNDFYSMKLVKSKLRNNGVIRGTVFADEVIMSNDRTIYGSPKDGKLVAISGNNTYLSASDYPLSRAIADSKIYGDIVLSGSQGSYISLEGGIHVGDVFLNDSFQGVEISGSTNLNGRVFASDYDSVVLKDFERPTEQAIEEVQVVPGSLLETYKKFEQAKTIKGTYSKYYFSNLVPPEMKNLPGKVTKTRNPTGTLEISGVISLEDFALDTDEEAMFYGVQKIKPALNGLIVYGLPNKSKSTYVMIEVGYLPVYFADLETCAVPGVIYDYAELQRMLELKKNNRLAVETRCGSFFHDKMRVKFNKIPKSSILWNLGLF